MEDYLDIISESPLFYDIPKDEIIKLLEGQCVIKSYSKDERIFEEGSRVTGLHLVLFGSLYAETLRHSGEQNILTYFKVGEVFGDVLMGSDARSPVSVYAAQNVKVLYIPFEFIMEQKNLRENLFQEISQKYFRLHRKIRYLSTRSLRARIAEYLRDCARDFDADTFDSGLSREAMAALLGVNRSALSRELSRMKNDNIISFYKSSFKVNGEKLKDCIIQGAGI